MPEHTLKRFDEELEQLNATISQMGGLTESQLAQCLIALRQGDTVAAERVIAEDARVAVQYEGATELTLGAGLFSTADLLLQARRMRNYSLRHFQNRIVSDIMREPGPTALPDRLASLYPHYLPQFRPRRDPRLWWFDRQALAAMARAAG